MIDRGEDHNDLNKLKKRIKDQLTIRTFCSSESLECWIAKDLGNWLNDPSVRKQLNLPIHDKTKTLIAVFRKLLIDGTITKAGRDEHLRATMDIFAKARGELYTAIDRLTVFRVFMEWIIDELNLKYSKNSNQTKNEIIENCIEELCEQQEFDVCEKIFNETNSCFKKIEHLLSSSIISDIPAETIAGVIKVMREIVNRCQENYINLIREYNLFGRLLADINRIADPDEKVDVDAPRLEL